MRKRAMVMLGFFAGFLLFFLPGLFLVNTPGFATLGGILLGIAVLMIVINIGYTIMGSVQPLWVRQLLQSGVEAKAIIIENNAVKGIGGYQGGDVWLDLPVRVQPVNGPAFEAKMKCRLTQTMLLRTGSEVTVRYDASNRNKVVLVGDSRTDMMTKYM